MKQITYGILAATLLLSPAAAVTDLGEILVTSTSRLPQKIKNSTANVTVITAEDIAERGYQSVTEALSRATGISISNNGGLGTTSSIFMRGMKTEKILVLLDGVILNNPTSTDGQAFFEHISLDNIEQIEIIEGGSASIWGTGASAGVINIITKKAGSGSGGSIAASYGSHHSKKLSGSLYYGSDAVNVIANLSTIDSKGFSAKLPYDAEADGYENKSANLKIAYNLDTKNKISLNYNYINANTEYDGGFSPLGANDPIANADTKQNDMTVAYEFSGEHFYSKILYTHSTVDRLDLSRSTYGDANVSYGSTIKKLTWLNRYNYSKESHIAFGAEYRSTEGENQFNNFPSTTNIFKDKAVFATLTHTFNHTAIGKTIVEASIRRDIFDKFENSWSYKIGAKHFFDTIDGLEASANYYDSTDAPNAYQFSSALAGTSLEPDSTKGYDLTLKYKDISVTYFANTIYDKISYDTNLWGYINKKGKEKIKGVELSMTHAYDDFVATINYTHLFTYEDENGKTLEKRAQDTLNANLDYYINDDTYIGIGAQYIGDRIEYDYGTYNIKAETGNYTVWDINFGTNITQDLSLKIHAKNIFDKKYATTHGYSTEGRSIYATIEYRF